MPYIQSRSVKAIALLARYRAPTLPDLATAHEQGLANFEAYQWFAIFLPKGTSPAIIERLHDATVVAMDTPAVQERLKQLGIELAKPQLSADGCTRAVEAAERALLAWAKLTAKQRSNIPRNGTN